MREINPTMVHSFVLGEDELQHGDTGSEVTLLQLLFEGFHGDMYVGRVDDVFGKATEAAVLKFQQYRLLDETGVVDLETRLELGTAFFDGWTPGIPFQPRRWSEPNFVVGPWHSHLGWLPGVALGRLEQGKMSTFGGPKDKGDRIYGQAYVDGDETPLAVYQRHPTLVHMGLLREEIKDIEEYPTVTDWKGRLKRADTSWCLNPDSFYCAMRWRSTGGKFYRNDGNPRVVVWNESNRKAVVCLRTDWGPHVRTGRLIDLSPGAEAALEIQTDDVVRVTWAHDGANIGPINI